MGGLDKQIEQIRDLIEIPLTRPDLFRHFGAYLNTLLSHALCYQLRLRLINLIHHLCFQDLNLRKAFYYTVHLARERRTLRAQLLHQRGPP